MHIHMLGTGAAEGIPNPFCACAVCTSARTLGGYDLRLRSSALINNDLLIDIGPDVIAAAIRSGVFLGDLKLVLMTHRHVDHLLPTTLLWRHPAFNKTPAPDLALYGSADTVLEFNKAMQAEAGEDKAGVVAYAVQAGQSWQYGRYRITAIPAFHGHPGLEVLLYVIDDGAHRIFYATDTGLLPAQAWSILEQCGPFDIVLLDHTFQAADDDNSHLGARNFLRTCEQLNILGLLKQHARIFAHHISHNETPSHAELAERLARSGYEVAYDGMQIKL